MPRSYKESVEESITPDFLQTSRSSEDHPEDIPEPQNDLKDYEQSAAEPKPSTESPRKSLYTGSGRPKSTNNPAGNVLKNLKNPNSSTTLKKAGPLTLLITALIAFVAILGGLVSQLGFHVQELLTVNTSRDYGNYQLLSRSTTRQILAGEYQMTDKFKSRLESQNISVITKEGGYDLEYNGTRISADNFDSVINDDPNFRSAFTNAKRGRVANFFDAKAEKFYKKLGITRNVFSDYKQTGDAETDAENYKKLYSEQFATDAETRTNTAEDRTTTDEDGNEVTERVASGEEIDTKSIEGDTPEAKASSYIQSVSNRVASGVSAADTGCAVLKIGSMVSMAIATYDMYQSIHQFMIQMEQVSKTKAGQGAAAALNAQNNDWMREATTTYTDVETGEEKSITGSFMSSEGIKLAVGEEPANKQLAKNYSTERGLLATLTAIGTNQLSTTACSTISATNAVLSLATLAVPGSGFVKLAVGAIKQIAVSTTIQIAISGLVAALVPIVARALFENPTDIIGIPSGEQTVKGASASAYLTATANSAFTPSSKERSLEANKINNIIIAQEAEEDRLNRSPLDTSSPNTFLGSIINKTLTISSSNNILSSFVNFSNLASSSLMPKTFAEGENSSYLSTFGDCPSAEEFGIACDIYGIPITASDPSTVDLSDNDPAYRAWLSKNIEINESNQQRVIPGSFLAEYIELVAGRESLPGNYDAGIADRALEYITGGVSNITQNIPYIQDVVELVNFANRDEVEAWARGTICKNSSDNPRWDSDCKYAQHYIQKSRILAQIDYYGENPDPVAVFETQSDYLNPTDTSRVAIFARLTGLAREDADFTLALIDYSAHLATYHPEDAYQFNAPNTMEMVSHYAQNTVWPLFTGRAQRGSASPSATTPVATGVVDAVQEKMAIGILRNRGLA